jgi:hypothetical protein
MINIKKFWKCLILVWNDDIDFLKIMGAIDMTFLSRPLRFMSCNISCFCMNSLKSIGPLMGG